ncbi:MAG TPA: hypothetical protein VFY28_00535 [Candidatus Paceibacterota bacterium]|nr:hypothetical protein [Candidatus Paceibacterota bacterium]
MEKLQSVWTYFAATAGENSGLLAALLGIMALGIILLIIDFFGERDLAAQELALDE